MSAFIHMRLIGKYFYPYVDRSLRVYLLLVRTSVCIYVCIFVWHMHFAVSAFVSEIMHHAACDAGKYKSTNGSDPCTSCPKGSVGSETAAVSSQTCTNCSAGSYTAASGTKCSTCPSSTYATKGAGSIDSCLCIAGYQGVRKFARKWKSHCMLTNLNVSVRAIAIIRIGIPASL